MQLIFENVHGNDEVYMDTLRAICGDTEGKSMVDCGCNLAPHTPLLGYKERVYVDVLDRVLDHPSEQQFFVKADMLEFLKGKKKYDCCISTDSIEHISITQGAKFVTLMEKHSDLQVIFTPLNAWMLDLEGDSPEGHHSVWTPDLLPDFASIVFKNYHPTLGIGAWFGWKCKNLEQDFERVKNELKTKEWAKQSLA